MKKINLMLQKCKSLTKQLARCKSASATTDHQHQLIESAADAAGENIIMWKDISIDVVGDRNNSDEQHTAAVLVGSRRKPYLIDSKYLSHPLVNALIEKSNCVDVDGVSSSFINCEVVLFDHLLWMLENSDFNFSSDSMDELADLYYIPG